MTSETGDNAARQIQIKGLVQGVGFRPFIYRLAVRNSLNGWVENRNDGVTVHIEGPGRALEKFLLELPGEAPVASSIRSVNVEESIIGGYDSFFIRKSENLSDEITDISPDIAVCKNCLFDMKNQPHRIDYPFINCTNCGPRFTIIRDLPYDREKTTMAPFSMCPDCKTEYGDIMDRRFHAQPVACNRCGPHYELEHGKIRTAELHRILEVMAELISKGAIIAVKGQGGFHLACDAANEEAVKKLRKRKNRYGKPFAVMFRDLEAAERFLVISQPEKEALTSWRRPIVLLLNRPDGELLASDVCAGFPTTGAMLPYMPLHYLLFEKLETDVIVLTSGNVSEEPIVTGNDRAKDHLGHIGDAFLTYDREISNRTDDSVLFVAGNKQRLIRRSRGYVPAPVNLSMDVDHIFAAGAELVNCFCLGRGSQAIISQHIGDLKNLETLEFYEESIRLFRKLFRVEPSLLACDLHPDYLSSRFAVDWARASSLSLVKVQHHHAHIASCMAEHGLDEKVIGISMDGVGLGSDGHIWGGEFLVCDLAGFERKAHLEYIPQPGGDKATEEPWRMAVAFLYMAYGPDLTRLDLPFLKNVDQASLGLVIKAIEHRINTPLTSSTGRLFDAVSAMTGLCLYSTFHAEAPMRLEYAMDPEERGSYELSPDNSIRTTSLVKSVVKDLLSGVPVATISTRFHHSIVNMIVQGAEKIREEHGLGKVVLSGGSFQNRFLLEQSEIRLRHTGFRVFTHEEIPSNDGGIALGQLIIAAKRKQMGLTERG